MIILSWHNNGNAVEKDNRVWEQPCPCVPRLQTAWITALTKIVHASMDNNCSEEIIILTMFMMLIVIMVIMFMFIRLMVMMIIPVLPFIIHDHDYICSEEFVVKFAVVIMFIMMTMLISAQDSFWRHCSCSLFMVMIMLMISLMKYFQTLLPHFKQGTSPQYK